MQHFLEEFTYADNTLLTAAGFTRVYPLGTIVTALEAKIGSNKAIGGGTASEKIYKILANTNGQRDYKTSAVLAWSNAAGASEQGGIGVRISDDGEEGYFAIIDSAMGAPVLYLVRRHGGVMVPLAGTPTSIDPLGPTDLGAGITPEIAVQTKTGSVRLRVNVNGTTFIDFEDTDANRIESGGSVGLHFGSTVALDDITFDDLQSSDFEDEATGGAALTEGLVVVVNGVYLAEFEWQGRGIDPISCDQSYQPAGSIALIQDLSPADSPALQAGDRIQLIHEGVFHGDGVLRKVDQDFQPPEGIIYELIGARDLCAEVPISDPLTSAGVIAFNQEEDSELYDPARGDATTGDNLEIGEIIAFVLDNAKDGDDGLRVRGAAPASGAVYVQAELDAMDMGIPHISISGNVAQAIETLLGYAPEYACFIDPETKVHHFHKRSASPFKEVNFTGAEGHVLPRMTTNPGKNRTVVIIRGVKRQSSFQPFTWSDSDPDNADGLQRDWQTELEAEVTEERKYVKEHGTTVLGEGVDDDGHIYVDVSTAGMVLSKNEWRGASLLFRSGSQDTRSYTIRSNTAGGRVVLRALAWIGSAPTAADVVLFTSGEGNDGLGNAFDDIGAAFRLPDGFSLAGGLCGDATVTKRTGTGATTKAVTFTVKIRKQSYNHPDTGLPVTRLRLERATFPIIDPTKDLSTGTISFGRSPCEVGGALDLPSEVTVTLNVFDPTKTAVPLIRLPAKGWEGTAFSFDATKYGTGKGPGPGDVGVQTPHVIEDGNFTDELLQGAEFTKYGQSVLNVLGALAREASFSVSGIDDSYAGLDKRIRFTDDTRTTGFETATDLWMMNVTWDYRANETRVGLGSMASGNVNLEAYRQAFAEKTRLDVQKLVKKKLEELSNCLDPSIHGGTGAVGAEGPIGTGDCKIATTYDYGTRKETTTQKQVAQKVSTLTLAPAPNGNTCVPVWACTITPGGAAALDQNAKNFDNVNIRVSQPAIFDATKGTNGEPSTGLGILAAVFCAIRHIQAIWRFLYSWSSSVDAQLQKAQIDLANVMGRLAQLEACVDRETAKIKVALPAYARVVCVTPPLAPTVCSPVCPAQVPIVHCP